jgi:hypothetical protein
VTGWTRPVPRLGRVQSFHRAHSFLLSGRQSEAMGIGTYDRHPRNIAVASSRDRHRQPPPRVTAPATPLGKLDPAAGHPGQRHEASCRLIGAGA